MSIHTTIILAFWVITIILFTVLYFVMIPRTTALKKRLEELDKEDFTTEAVSHKKPLGMWSSILSMIGQKIPLNPKDYNKYTKILVTAGIRGELLPVFVGIKMLSLFVFPGIYLLFIGLPLGHSLFTLAMVSSILALVGYVSPNIAISRLISNRQLKIFHDLPDILDLMTVCVEAGLSMDSAMLKISEDKQFAKSPLAMELKQCVNETLAGKSRHDALKDMGERSMVNDLKSFVAMLIQTDRLGTSLSNSLRVHSDTLRTKRRQLAEEEAAKTTVKLVFPLVFLLFPSMFVVLLVPAFIRMTKFFSEL